MAITTINGNAGSDLITLLGSEYPDSLTIDSNNLYVNTREGKDTITGSSTVEYVSIESGESNDTLTFTSEVVGSNFKLGNGDDNLMMTFQDRFMVALERITSKLTRAGHYSSRFAVMEMINSTSAMS